MDLRHTKKEQRLVRCMLDGDAASFDDFVDRYAPALYRFAMSRLDRDEELARELVQASLCKAIEKLGTFRGESALLSWLCSICRNEIAAHFRRSRRDARFAPSQDDLHPLVIETLASGLPGPAEELRRAELMQLVHLTLDDLPERYGQALEWKYLEDLSVHEIAHRLGIGAKAAESVLTRARVAFRRGFEGISKGLDGRGYRGLRAVS